jgi:hypothetical protein
MATEERQAEEMAERKNGSGNNSTRKSGKRERGKK